MEKWEREEMRGGEEKRRKGEWSNERKWNYKQLENVIYGKGED